MIVPRPPTAEDEARARAEKRRAWELTAAGRKRGPLEIWHLVGTAGELSFRNNWRNSTGNYNPCSFLKQHDGFVRLRASVTHSNAPQGSVFVLPANYRPPYSEYMLAGAVLSNGTRSVVPLLIANTGGVVVPALGSGLTRLFFDDITWRAAG